MVPLRCVSRLFASAPSCLSFNSACDKTQVTWENCSFYLDVFNSNHRRLAVTYIEFNKLMQKSFSKYCFKCRHCADF